MATFIFRCPIAGVHVQGWTERDDFDPDEYESLLCLACQRVHLVNPATARVLGSDE
jgi:hypothetical protein